MNRLDDQGTYPIREFARITGVNPVTLRAWERRYGIIRPERTGKGHRFYTDAHIAEVKHILYWLDQGYPIRQVRLLTKEGQTTPQSLDLNQEWQALRAQLLLAAQSLNAQLVEECLNTGFATYPLAVYYDYCLQPVLSQLRGEDGALHSKSFEYLVSRKLAAVMMQHQRHIKGPAVLSVCNHPQAELETLTCACALSAAEFRVEYFGPQLTPADVQRVSHTLDVSHIWLHVSPLADGHDWQAFIRSSDRPLMVSGHLSFPLPEHKDTRQMPDRLAPQVRQFITCAAGTVGDKP